MMSPDSPNLGGEGTTRCGDFVVKNDALFFPTKVVVTKTNLEISPRIVLSLKIRNSGRNSPFLLFCCKISQKI